ncbi:unnamed protein product [Diamesa serratosioi]
MTNVSQVRQNFHEQCEEGINKQINMELYASYVYLALAYHFDRDDIALFGLHDYFKKASYEEREHAELFLKYLNQRGGRIILKNIAAIEVNENLTALEAMQQALDLEKQVNQSLLDLHSVSATHNDANLCDFLETNFLQEQIDGIKEIGDHVTNLRRVGEGLGVYIFDKELAEKCEIICAVVLGLIKRCYQCRSRGELGNCKDPFQYNATQVEDVHGVTAIPCASGWCGKVIEGESSAFREDDFDMATQRMCVQRGPDDSEDRCAYTVYNYKKVFMCFCQGDLCNGTISPFSVSNKLLFCVSLIGLILNKLSIKLS